jgi:hypothetical protein
MKTKAIVKGATLDQYYSQIIKANHLLQWRSENGPENTCKKIWGAWLIAPVKKQQKNKHFMLKIAS